MSLDRLPQKLAAEVVIQSTECIEITRPKYDYQTYAEQVFSSLFRGEN